MSTKKKNIGDCTTSLRPASAKSNRPVSASGGKNSARSTASVESELSDFLSISGAKTSFQKNSKHRRSQSGSLRTQNDSDSESVQTSGSSGARRKTVNINSGGNLRHASGHASSKKLQSSSKPKASHSLATNFQLGRKAVPSDFLPNRPTVSSQGSLEGPDDQDWWIGVNSRAPVPPLPELKSPSDLEHKKIWWPDSENLNQAAADTVDDDHLEEWWTNSMMDKIINSVAVDNGVSASQHVNKVAEDSENETPQKTLKDSPSQAAVIIQKWFRGWRVRRHQRRSAVQQLLQQKKEEKKLQFRMSVSENELQQQKEVEKMKRREEKARQARQAAIQDLQRKREEKKQGNQRKVEEEMMFLQASGKVTKKKSNANPKLKPRKSNSKVEKIRKESNSSDAPSSPRPGTAGSTARKVEELFEGSRISSTEQEISSDTSVKPSLEILTDRTDKTVTSTDVGASKVTFDDLLESLKQLEEEPEDLLKAPARKDNIYGGWVKDFGLQEDGGENKPPYLSLGKLDHLGRQEEAESHPRASLSAEKLRNILTFLDEVEKAEEDTRTEISQVRDGARSRGVVSPSASVSVAVDREKEQETLQAASVAASDVTNAMMAVKIELEEKKRTADLLQRALNQQREFTLRQAKEMEKDAKQRLAIQRQEYESAIQRHLSFIDQLIDDKKALSERCEELVKKLKEIDHKYTKKITEMEESHNIEIKKQKEVILAAEKLRREKWINEKTQQIKEVTVKGLEPDIQRLIAKHKAEIKKIKSVHQAELLEADERAGRRYIQQIEELRDQLEREKDAACTRERELAQQRLEKQMEQEEQAYQQQRRRLYAEVQEEKERIALQAQRQRMELDDARVALEDSHKKSIMEMQAGQQKAIEDLERRHQLEMNELKERLEIEKQSWIENYMKKQDALLLTKERELKEGVRDARDREIEMVITRLEEETALAREECERAAENRIKRVRDKYEAELAELERSERNMHDKYNSMKERLTELEGDCSRQRSLLKQKEQEVEDMDRVTKRLQEERGKVSDIIRQEFADRLVTTDEDNKRLKTDISEMRARHRLEIERITKEKEKEMEEVHKRVKQAISKKEETMKVLREQHQAATKRADHLEFLLQEQRKKLLH